MTERERLMHEMNIIGSMQWLIKDCITAGQAWDEMQKAYDARAAKVAMMTPPSPPPIIGPALGDSNGGER